MTRAFDDILADLSDLPEGGAEQWKQRYEPLIDEVVRHRELESPDVSVVVVGWRSAASLPACLRSIRRQRGMEREDVELVLVDNGGLDAIRETIASRADLELRMKGNARLCRARNAGVAWANGKHVAFVDDDATIRPDYLERALAYFDDETVAGIRGRIVPREHPYLTALARHYDRGAEPVEDCLVTEGNSVLRRECFIEARGFAEALAGHEGIDLTFRLEQLDPAHRTLYAPDVVMAHDYIDNWRHFFDKSLGYSDIEAEVLAERPELEAFFDRYFSRSFPPPRHTLPQRVARTVLEALREVLQLFSSARTT